MHSTEVGWVAAVIADVASQWGRCATQGRPANENMLAIEICWICLVMYRLPCTVLKHSIQTFVVP